MLSRTIIHLGFALLVGACQKASDNLSSAPVPLLEVPSHFPLPEFPEDNGFSEPRWELGKLLFFDERLSDDESTSCASCHLPAFAFSDTVSFSSGSGQAIGTRNAPTLANVAYHPYYTRDGGVPSLEMQVLVPIQEHNEFNFNILEIVERLLGDDQYQMLAMEAYNREFDHYVLTRALATFERSMISGDSRYDRSLTSNNSMTELELTGMKLFFSDRAHCSVCHEGFNFTSYAFENNGLYNEYEDPGRFRLTGKEYDRARFKVPSLRNVAVTSPYMHDGSIQSLEAVIDHYNSGGHDHFNKSDLITPLYLNDQEKSALVAFLKTLTDEAFINNEKFKQ